MFWKAKNKNKSLGIWRARILLSIFSLCGMHSLEIKTVKFAQLEMRLDSQIFTHFSLYDMSSETEI